MPFEIRNVCDSAEFEAWYRAGEAMFGAPEAEGEDVALQQTLLPLDRTLAVLDGERMVGTAGAYPFDMTVPGGETLPVAGVTLVTVTSTHRRRGILRQLMSRQLDDVAARGEPIAVLNASESSIYGRFGYGIAQLYQRYELNTLKSAFARAIPERSRPLRLLNREEAAKELPSIYDACRLRRPGMLSQSEQWWSAVLARSQSWHGGGKLFVVVADADEGAGTGPGFALYRIDARDAAGRWTLTVFDMQAADHQVEAQLFRYLLDVDLVGKVVFEGRPLDCTLRWWLREPREARVVHVGDFLWVRLIDIERSLATRRYGAENDLVIDIDDPFRGEASGKYRVSGGPEDASCERTDHPADLAMDISELGAIYLGQTRPSALAAAGRVSELTQGSLARADAFFGWPVAPDCATRF